VRIYGEKSALALDKDATVDSATLKRRNTSTNRFRAARTRY
jgi:hypothetical protein